MLPSAAMATARYPSQLMAASAFTSPLTRGGGGGGANPHDLHSISRASVAASKSTIQIRSILVNNVAHPITQSVPAFRSTFSGKAYRATRPQATLHAVSVAEERSIAVGEKLPDAELSYLDKSDNIQTVRVSDITRGKKVIIFAVPGAFTPTCTQKHVPGFLEKAEELKAKGVDTIACVSVNDVFVMKAWGESLAVNDKILLLSDGSAEFTNALGVTLDLTGKPQGLGVRSRSCRNNMWGWHKGWICARRLPGTFMNYNSKVVEIVICR